MSDKALAGLKVVELSDFIAGPYCGKLLADFGAEVVKVEKPGIGDEARQRGPFPGHVPHPEKSGLFLYLNTNKLSITLDVERATGQRILKEILKTADILVEDRPPAQMETLGLDFKTLHKVNPALIVVSITAFGQSGPYRDYKGYAMRRRNGP
jgi:crotonobetainyl-CoA:carnitine CoA-transferase CaiB-like acyl-CoA transferase